MLERVESEEEKESESGGEKSKREKILMLILKYIMQNICQLFMKEDF